jgi:HlyD family secretion protein
MVSVEDDGRTRVRERYVISAPVDGRLLRTALEPGDSVLAGETLVAEFAPTASRLLDARTRAESQARAQRAEAALAEAEARRTAAEAELELATAQAARIRELSSKGLADDAALDQAVFDERRAQAGLEAAEFAVQVGRFEREIALASLIEPVEEGLEGARSDAPLENLDGSAPTDGRMLLRSPIDGAVLRVFEESARTLPAGTPILEVGNVEALEVVADFLTTDAVRIQPGQEVPLAGWGSELGATEALAGRVRVVEPGGFTKISALGVEEQRVNVIVDLDPPRPGTVLPSLGDGYRVDVEVVLWRGEDLLLVPTGALFPEAGSWFVFAIEDGRATRRELELGRQGELAAEVRSGLEQGERVVLYPSELIEDGTRVSAR